MMRRWLLLLALTGGLLAPPAQVQAQAQAQSPDSFDAMVEALDPFIQNNDMDGAYALLSTSLRDARVGGWLSRDWSLFFAMQADFARLSKGNPAYALQLTEDGLALIAGDPAQADFAAALMISRAYALADLGRFAEAAESATLALPAFRKMFGDADAADLEARIAQWARGELSDFNTSAADLADATLERARAAMSDAAYGRAVALAAGAILPYGTNLPEGRVRQVNFSAEQIVADALQALGRRRDAGDARVRALGHLTATPWQAGQPFDWFFTGWSGDSKAVLFAFLIDLASDAARAGNRDLARAALSAAADFTTTADDRNTLVLQQASFSFTTGDAATARALIAETRDKAAAAGEADLVAMSDFYTAVVAARQAWRDGRDVDPAPILRAARAALAVADEDGGIDRLSVLRDASRLIAPTPAHTTVLPWAREVLKARRAALEARSDTSFAQAEARKAARQEVETFLRAANGAAGGLDPAIGEFCPQNPGFQSCVLVWRRDN